MKIGFKDFWIDLGSAHEHLPESPREIEDRVSQTGQWTPRLPLPRWLGQALREVKWQ